MDDYSTMTYWVLFVCIVFAAAMVWLFRSGKASLKLQIVVGLLFSGSIAGMHWGFGGQHLMPEDFSGGAFFLTIVIGAALINLLLALTVWPIFNALSQVHIQMVQGLRVFVGGGFLMAGVLEVIPGWFSPNIA